MLADWGVSTEFPNNALVLGSTDTFPTVSERYADRGFRHSLLGQVQHSDAEAFHLGKWLPRIRAAIERLDLIVFLPVEARDRIALPSSQDPGFRLDVDQKLKEIFLDDSLELDLNVIEVTGPVHERVKQVLRQLRGVL